MNLAVEAVMVEARRLATLAPAPEPEQPPMAPVAALAPEPAVEVEVPVRSRDGLFTGRVDVADHGPDGVRLIDYKSAVRDDVPGRYARQLQLYAFLWHETRGVWPRAAELVYPFLGTSHAIDVSPALCERVVAEARALVARVRRASDPTSLATPGDTCKICAFRPWCRPFWTWQAAEPQHRAALDRAYLGFEGPVAAIADRADHWTVQIRWRGVVVQLRAPRERFPQLTPSPARPPRACARSAAARPHAGTARAGRGDDGGLAGDGPRPGLERDPVAGAVSRVTRTRPAAISWEATAIANAPLSTSIARRCLAPIELLRECPCSGRRCTTSL